MPDQRTMTNLREQEDTLFAHWRQELPNLITDGVVDASAYLASSRRILFVLKEVNSPDQAKPWDLRGFLFGGGRSATWNAITYWVEGIRALPADLSWQQVCRHGLTNEQRAHQRSDALRSIAVVNFKKSPGLHTANARQVSKSARRDRAFIRQQIHLYQADLIICCGVGHLVNELDLFDDSPAKQQTSRGVSYYQLSPDRYLIDYLHPEARCADNLLYYGLIDALREITAM